MQPNLRRTAEIERRINSCAREHGKNPRPMLQTLTKKSDMLTKGYHQQYLAKNPNGYCGIGGCGVPFKLAELQVGEKA
jgi:peptide methionine sulfoxide reductase MsrA